MSERCEDSDSRGHREPVAGSLEQDPAEGPAEVLVEDGVDDGIEGGVHVTQPEGNGERLLGYREVREERLDDVEEEEGQPAGDEAAHYQAQYKRRPLLLLPGYPALLALGVARLLRLRLDDDLLVVTLVVVVVMVRAHLLDGLAAEDGLAETQL